MGGCCSAPIDVMEEINARDRSAQAASGGGQGVPAPPTPQPAAPVAASGLGPRELTFTNPKGEKLVGILMEAGSDDVVILCHGYVANMSMCQFPKIASELAAAGVCSFRFDHPCAIFSQSERKGPFLMGNHKDEVADMAAAVEFMRSLGKRVVCLLGHSKGGMNSVIFAARHHDVPKIINLAGRFCPREGALQRFGSDILERLAREKAIPQKEAWGEWELTEEDVRNRIDQDMVAFAKAIPPTTRMLCLHGEDDTTIPYQESEECAAAVGPNATVRLIPGGDHNFKGKEAGEAVAKAVVDFVLS